MRNCPEETRRFGVKVARADNVSGESFPSVLDYCRLEAISLMMLRCDVRDMAVIHAAGAAGFQIMDTIVYTAADPHLVAVQQHGGAFSVRLATSTDIAAVTALARNAFDNYVSHYHADPRLLDHASAIYEEWAERLCRQSSDLSPVILAETPGLLAGFAALQTNDSEAQLDCELCAVATAMQGLGVFKSLLAEMAAWARGRGIARLTYSTQIQNTTVLKGITRNGFWYDGAKHTFHKWFDVETDRSDRSSKT